MQKLIREKRIVDLKKPVLLPYIDTTGDKIVGWKKAMLTSFYICRITADLLSKEERKGGIKSEKEV